MLIGYIMLLPVLVIFHLINFHYKAKDQGAHCSHMLTLQVCDRVLENSNVGETPMTFTSLSARVISPGQPYPWKVATLQPTKLTNPPELPT